MAISGLEEAQIAARFERRLDEIRAEGVVAERARIRRELEELLDLQEAYDPAFQGEYRHGLLAGSERAVDAIRRGLDRIIPEKG